MFQGAEKKQKREKRDIFHHGVLLCVSVGKWWARFPSHGRGISAGLFSLDLYGKTLGRVRDVDERSGNGLLSGRNRNIQYQVPRKCKLLITLLPSIKQWYFLPSSRKECKKKSPESGIAEQNRGKIRTTYINQYTQFLAPHYCTGTAVHVYLVWS